MWEAAARGRRYGDICICIADSLCYKAETNTTMLSRYTPIKMFKKIIMLFKVFAELAIILSVVVRVLCEI